MLSHSAAVHIPLAIAVLFPMGYGAIYWMIKFGGLAERAWILMWGLAGIQIANTVLAYRTGLRDRPFSPAPAEMLSRHEYWGLIFMCLWVLIAAILPFGYLWAHRRSGKWVHGVLLILMAAQLASALQLGHLGGQIMLGELNSAPPCEISPCDRGFVQNS